MMTATTRASKTDRLGVPGVVRIAAARTDKTPAYRTPAQKTKRR